MKNLIENAKLPCSAIPATLAVSAAQQSCSSQPSQFYLLSVGCKELYRLLSKASRTTYSRLLRKD